MTLTEKERGAALHTLAGYRRVVADLLRESADWSLRYRRWNLKAIAAEVAGDQVDADYCGGMAARCYREAESCHERRGLYLGVIAELEGDLV